MYITRLASRKFENLNHPASSRASAETQHGRPASLIATADSSIFCVPSVYTSRSIEYFERTLEHRGVDNAVIDEFKNTRGIVNWKKLGDRQISDASESSRMIVSSSIHEAGIVREARV